MTIKQIRALTGLSQAKFGKKYDIPLNTIKNWECEDGKANHRDCPEYVLYLLERAVMEDTMTELEVNDYIAAAEEALKDDPTLTHTSLLLLRNAKIWLKTAVIPAMLKEYYSPYGISV